MTIEEAHTDVQKADVLKNCFSACWNTSLPPLADSNHVKYDIPTDLSNILCSEEEILRVLRNLNCTKVTGPDGIISSTVCKPSNNLFNLCVRQNSFPPLYIFPNMVPIPKTSSGKSTTFKLQAIVIAANQVRRNDVDISNLKTSVIITQAQLWL